MPCQTKNAERFVTLLLMDGNTAKEYSAPVAAVQSKAGTPIKSLQELPSLLRERMGEDKDFQE
jgi:hypothetical protein